MQHKFASLLSVVLLCITQILAFSNTIYVVREAERASLGAGGLSPVGRSRASSCMVSRFGLSSSADIGKIISCRPDPDTGKCDAAFQTVAVVAGNLSLNVDVTCTTDESKSIETCVFELIKAFVATSNKAILIAWDIEEMDQIFDNFELENDDPEFPEFYPDMIATIKNNVFQGFASQDCAAIDGNSGSPLTASTTINPAIPTPTTSSAPVRRDLASQTSAPVPAITFGTEEFSSGLTSASTTLLPVSSTSTGLQPTTSTSALPSVEFTIPFSDIAPSITTLTPPIATTGPNDIGLGAGSEEVTPLAIEVEVEINVGGRSKHRKGCKYAASVNATETTSVSATGTESQPIPTSSEVPLETAFSTKPTSSASGSSILSSATSTPSAVLPTDSTSINSVVTGSITESTISSTTSSALSVSPLQTPAFGASVLGRMIRRHKRQSALRL